MNLPVIFLMGATTTGKTSVAINLCDKYPLDIISVDSAMVYKGMDIGTAKPDREVLSRYPHRLVDICDPADPYSAARFRMDAIAEIEAIHANNRIPLLVGGTGLYFRSLESGISRLPQANSGIRKQIENEAKKTGWQKMHQHLAEVDPVTAARIHPNDPQRIQRALEVFQLSGQPMSFHFEQQTAQSLNYPVIKIILHTDDRNIIHQRIKTRFMQMLNDGLIDEVNGFYQRGDLDASLPAMRLVGYRQIWKYLEGELSHDEMVNHSIVATRQLSKRQITWLRKEENACWIDCENTGILAEVLQELRKNKHLSVRM